MSTTREPDAPVWSDPTQPSVLRARDLLERMTPRERLSQLGSCWIGNEVISGNVAPMQDVFNAGAIAFADQRRDGLGHLTRPFGTRPIAAEEGVQQLIGYQQAVMASNRFGIPAIAHEECLTGFTAWGATVYPAAIAWGATWDPDLIEEMAHAIGSDMCSVGVHQGLSPLLDVVRDYRWGRVEETIGEDPLLVGTLGTAYVQGLQRGGVIATLKHFAGYSASRAGRNHAPVSMGPREFREVMLVPFEMAVRYGKARSVMNSYSDVDGVPAGADHALLTDTLRNEWGFDGTVVSDYWSIAFMRTMHHVAETFDDAALLALRAGLDVELPDALAFGEALLARIESGEVDVRVLDTAVLRVLRQKIDLGLLDPDWRPEYVVSRANTGESPQLKLKLNLNSDANQAIATCLAEQSVILLANNAATLPLRPPPATRIAVVGPTAHDALAFMGCYSFPNHVLPHHPGFDLGIEAPSLLDALRREFPACEFVHALGVPVSVPDGSAIADATEVAKSCDIVVLAVGDRAGLFGHGTSGEGTDTNTLRLPGLQHELAERVIAANPATILVAITGRPYAIADFPTPPLAIVQAFMPGQNGGSAIAGVLSGRVNPSGRLPVQIPRLHGPQPSTYLQAPLGLHSEGVSNLDPTPAFAFGHGLSYTTFEFASLTVDRREITGLGEIVVTVEVVNTGDRSGSEVVQLYLIDHVAQTVRPAQKLLAFQRVTLDAGERVAVSFVIHADMTSFIGLGLTRIVEPGRFSITAGPSAVQQPLRAEFTITGAVREVSRNWTMCARATVRRPSG